VGGYTPVLVSADVQRNGVRGRRERSGTRHAAYTIERAFTGVKNSEKINTLVGRTSPKSRLAQVLLSKMIPTVLLMGF
jgi:hypothetical protein